MVADSASGFSEIDLATGASLAPNRSELTLFAGMTYPDPESLARWDFLAEDSVKLWLAGVNQPQVGALPLTASPDPVFNLPTLPYVGGGSSPVCSWWELENGLRSVLYVLLTAPAPAPGDHPGNSLRTGVDVWTDMLDYFLNFLAAHPNP